MQTLTFGLIQHLIKLCLTTEENQILPIFHQVCEKVPVKEWEQIIATLNLHRLTPLVTYKLHTLQVLNKVPEPYRSQLKTSYTRTQKANKLFLLTLDAILKMMQKHHVNPVVWKGAMLADSVYPDPGTRMMGDLDFAICSQEMMKAAHAFQALGFIEKKDLATNEAIYFSNPLGVLCDVHHRVRLFEGKEAFGLTHNLIPQHMSVETLPVLEPNALLVHLVVHMDGHLPETGPILQWIVDVAFVLQKWQGQFNLNRIEALMPNQHSLELLFRVIGFLEVECGCVFQDSLSQAATTVPPLKLTTLLRQRRLLPWRLSRPKSWIKLIASQLGLLTSSKQPLPLLQDWVWLPHYALLGGRW